MQTDQLRYLIMTAELGNMTRAAEALHISQPALSASIARLETEIGTKLFDRVNRQLLLTKDGAVLLSAAKDAVDILDKALSSINASSSHNEDKIYIRTWAMVRFSSIIHELIEKVPNISVSSYNEDGTEDLESLMLSGKADIILTRTSTDNSKIECRTLLSDHLKLFVSNAHPLYSCDRISVELLQGMPLVLLPRSSFYRRMIDRRLSSCGVSPEVIFEISGMRSILPIIENGSCGTILSEIVSSNFPSDTFKGIEIVGVDLTINSFLWNRKKKKYKTNEQLVIDSIIDYFNRYS